MINIVESAQQSGTRFKFIRQQKDWAFSFDKWGCRVNNYIVSVLEMEPDNCLVLCDEANQMAKSIVKKVTKGLSTLSMSQTWAQPTKALGQHTLLKEGHPPTFAPGVSAVASKSFSILH